jgi:hypothetical protein
MVLPQRLKPLTRAELGHLTEERLLAYRKKALSLENSLAASDYTDMSDSLDPRYIWFKDDPRWQPLYDAVLEELNRKQILKRGE